MQGGQQAERQHRTLLRDAVVGQVQQHQGGEAAGLCTQGGDGILMLQVVRVLQVREGLGGG